jgi:hypothetical protein
MGQVGTPALLMRTVLAGCSGGVEPDFDADGVGDVTQVAGVVMGALAGL